MRGGLLPHLHSVREFVHTVCKMFNDEIPMMLTLAQPATKVLLKSEGKVNTGNLDGVDKGAGWQISCCV